MCSVAFVSVRSYSPWAYFLWCLFPTTPMCRPLDDAATKEQVSFRVMHITTSLGKGCSKAGSVGQIMKYSTTIFVSRRFILLITGSTTKNWFAHAPTCEDSRVMKQISDSNKVLVEKENAAWFGGVQRQLERLYTASSPGEPENWEPFDVFMPDLPVCPSMRRIGGDGDGGKWICGMDQLTSDRPCIIYSIGSDNNFLFEEDIYTSTSCQVWTFDCTTEGFMPEYIRDRVFFHPICVGDPKNGDVFMSLKQIMAMLGHSYITLLKADIVSTIRYPFFPPRRALCTYLWTLETMMAEEGIFRCC